jgi:hypothetical protein
MTPRVPDLVVSPPEPAVESGWALDSAFALWWMDFLAIAGVRDFTTPRLVERAFSP